MFYGSPFWETQKNACVWVSEWVGEWVSEWVGGWVSEWVSEHHLPWAKKYDWREKQTRNVVDRCSRKIIEFEPLLANFVNLDTSEKTQETLRCPGKTPIINPPYPIRPILPLGWFQNPQNMVLISGTLAFSTWGCSPSEKGGSITWYNHSYRSIYKTLYIHYIPI